MEAIKKHFEEAKDALEQFIADKKNIDAIALAGTFMLESIRTGKKILSCGNGGSMCDAMHFAEELTGRYRNERPALPAICISDPSHISCVGNDYGYAHVFSRMVEAIGKEGDTLLAISTSGNSENIINAIQMARSKGLKVIVLTGQGGGRISSLCHVEVRAPDSAYADRAQEIHIKVIHALIDFIEQSLW